MEYGSIGTYTPTEESRSYIKIPFDKTQKSCMELFQLLENIGDYVVGDLDNIINLSHMVIYNKNMKKNTYQYYKLVNKSYDNDDDDNEQNKHFFPKYCKFKIPHNDNDRNKINVKLYVLENGNVKQVDIQCHKLKDHETRTFNIGLMNHYHCASFFNVIYNFAIILLFLKQNSYVFF